jgi:hypothetical protein
MSQCFELHDKGHALLVVLSDTQSHHWTVATRWSAGVLFVEVPQQEA